jgi:uncharacterized protein YjbI with pentapeptide repeats/membrane-associated phospholipid phosphatase
VKRPIPAFAVLVLSVSACTAPGQGTGCLDDPEKSCVQADLSGADLSGADLRGWNFSGADLSGADLSGADLSGADLDHAVLNEARLDGATLSAATLFNADGRGSSWKKADLSGADLEGTDLRMAALDGAVLRGARLHDVNLSGGSLVDVDLGEALLARVFLGGSALTGANLERTVLADTRVDDVDLTGTSWQGAVLRATDEPPAVVRDRGALVCGDLACEGTPEPGPFPKIELTPAAFRTAAFGAARFVSMHGESPTVASRGFALAFIAAYGVYPGAAERGVPHWQPVPQTGTENVRDVAATLATYNTAVALRRNPRGVELDGKMRGVMLSRDVMLWELTRGAPGARGLISSLAVESARLAVERGKQDGFADRTNTYDGNGAWVPTLPGWAPALEPGWGELDRYLPGSEACAADGPTQDPEDAARELVEITAKITDDQKAAARFWDDERLRTPTPPGHWVIIAAQVLSDQMSAGTIDAEKAFLTMFDLVTAMGDTFIQVWVDKYTHRTARPITVLDGSVPGWNSYLGNPPFPAYPSGHAAVSRAAAEVLTRHLGPLPFTDQGANESSGGWLVLGITPREFSNFMEAAEEAGLSRIWGGIHVMEDYLDGAAVGACVARLTAR